MTANKISSCIKLLVLAVSLLAVSAAVAEECKMAGEIDPSTRSAIESAAQRYYQAMASGNTTELQQNAIPAVAGNFTGIQAVVTENKANFGPSANLKGTYELDAPGNAPIARAEFYCGIMNSASYVAFAIPNLPPGNYAITILEPQGGKSATHVSLVLQQVGSQWKIGGLYIRPKEIAGHDSEWFRAQAQQFKAKGEVHSAWFYYLTAWDLAAPVQFMSTKALDKLADELQTAHPQDLPSPQQPVDIPSAGKTYKMTTMFAVPSPEGLGLVVKFQVPDVSNTSAAYADNIAVMKGLLAKYPELRPAFTSIVARATAPSGDDYGTLLAMKDIK